MTTTEARPIGFYLVQLDALINNRFEATLGRRAVAPPWSTRPRADLAGQVEAVATPGRRP